uniref:Delta-lactam-biosynthetic de-N-acetylase n=2 Tax=Cohnella candidum TaxID=2674991 RepID=A0A3G3JVV7_9BACL|nr:delta-lactam-biosynthetic de-N-acetylase [Cohnella candidum]
MRYLAWFVVLSVILLTVQQTETQAQDRSYHFGFKKSRNGALPSIDEEGFKPILQRNGAIFTGDTRKKELFLTFDNGYENGFTPSILDVLKAKQVPAAFFVTGHYVKDRPDLVKRMAQEGHIVGNHSWSHPDMTQVSDERIKTELDRVRESVAQLTGRQEMRFLRPPRGIFNERTLRTSRTFGYTNVFWSIAYKDWDVNQQRGPDYAYRMVIAQLHPGAVILLHSVSKDNASALGRIIDEARRQGYAFQSLDRLVQSTAAPANLTVTLKGAAIATVDRNAYVWPVFPLVRLEKMRELLDELERKSYTAPQNAVIGSHGQIVAERNGYQLDRRAMADRLYDYLYGNSGLSHVEVPLKTIYAKVDGELLSQLRDKQIGYYTTYYNAGNRGRSHNISLAARVIDSKVVFPGESFSFNRTVGMRTTKAGYRRAPIIVQGELSEGIGGGICQVSSTLFNAVDRAGLTILERYSHSRRVPYVPSGRDATVSWGGPDFVFRNPYAQPVLIRASAGGGRVYVAIFSSESIHYSPRVVPGMLKGLPPEVADPNQR